MKEIDMNQLLSHPALGGSGGEPDQMISAYFSAALKWTDTDEKGPHRGNEMRLPVRDRRRHLKERKESRSGKNMMES
jgi:hypothetical protein